MADYEQTKTTETITTTPKADPYEARTLPSYQAQTDAVNNQYDAAINSQRLALENAYNQNRTELERAAEKIPESYNNALNNQASAYERQRQAFNERAAGSGIGTGTGSQAALAMNVANQGNMASINKARADAITDAQNKITDLHTNYQNSVAEAVAQNDYQRAVQMLNEYRTQAQSLVQTAQAQADEDYRAYQSQLEREGTSYSRTQEQAKLLSQYGDFSGYENLYGKEIADQMKLAWAASNPDLAYYSGAINAAVYKAITGKDPKSGTSLYDYNQNNEGTSASIDAYTQALAAKKSSGGGGGGGTYVAPQYRTYYSSSSSKPTTGNSGEQDGSAANYNSVLGQAMRESSAVGAASAIANGVSSGRISSSQADQIQSIINKRR